MFIYLPVNETSFKVPNPHNQSGRGCDLVLLKLQVHELESPLIKACSLHESFFMFMPYVYTYVACDEPAPSQEIYNLSVGIRCFRY